MAADEQVASLAQKRLNEASEICWTRRGGRTAALGLEEVRGHVAHDLKVDSEIPGFLREGGKLQEMKPLAETLEAKTKCICEKCWREHSTMMTGPE